MSTSIRVSYEAPDELAAIVRRLAPWVRKTRLQPPKGKYRLAYLTMKDIPVNPDEEAAITICACPPPGDML